MKYKVGDYIITPWYSMPKMIVEISEIDNQLTIYTGVYYKYIPIYNYKIVRAYKTPLWETMNV